MPPLRILARRGGLAAGRNPGGRLLLITNPGNRDSSRPSRSFRQRSTAPVVAIGRMARQCDQRVAPVAAEAWRAGSRRGNALRACPLPRRRLEMARNRPPASASLRDPWLRSGSGCRCRRPQGWTNCSYCLPRMSRAKDRTKGSPSSVTPTSVRSSSSADASRPCRPDGRAVCRDIAAPTSGCAR